MSSRVITSQILRILDFAECPAYNAGRKMT
jgi:hypothetical protein